MPSIPASVSDRLLRPYRRITSSGQFIAEIDGLRFIAIISVYIYHLAGDVLRHSTAAENLAFHSHWLYSVTQILNVGVPLFFVISGFILGMPFAAARLHRQRPVSLKKYFLRRVTRLEPPYILCMLLFFALKIFGGRGGAGELLPNLLASLFYVHNVAYGAPSVISIVAWSLEIEIQFYILAPALASVFAISNASMRRCVLAILLVAATSVSAVVSAHPPLQLSLLGYAQFFLAGFLLAEFQLSGWLRRQASWLWDLVSIFGWVLLLAGLGRGGSLVDWFSPWLILLLYVAAFRGRVMNRFVSNAWIATIGGMCYSIYLLHNYIVAAAGLVTERFFATYPFESRLLAQFVLITPVVLILSALYFRAIERPCMNPDWPSRVKAQFAHLKSRWFLTPGVVSATQSAPEE